MNDFDLTRVPSGPQTPSVPGLRTLIVSAADPDGPSWLDAEVQAHCILPREDAPETCAETIHLTVGVHPVTRHAVLEALTALVADEPNPARPDDWLVHAYFEREPKESELEALGNLGVGDPRVEPREAAGHAERVDARIGRPVEREITQPKLQEKIQPLADLGRHRLIDRLVVGVDFDFVNSGNPPPGWIEFQKGNVFEPNEGSIAIGGIALP